MIRQASTAYTSDSGEVDTAPPRGHFAPSQADVALAEPFRDLLAEDLMVELGPVEPRKRSVPADGHSLVAGSIKGDLVGTAGFEPATSRV